MRDISKTFGAARALSGVSFAVHAGSVHALMGENGAGKSTLMKILSGAYRADPGGTILVDSAVADIRSPEDALRLGIAVIYQELSLAPNLTVAENMFLGHEMSRRGFSDRAAQEARCRFILQRLAADFLPSSIVSRLSMGQRQLVEIARALLADARIIVMDEPTTSLSEKESLRLFDVIEDLKTRGIAIIYISHRMEEIYRLADKVSVLRDGQSVGTLTGAEISSARLISMMVGRDISTFYKKQHSRSQGEDVALAVQDLGDNRLIQPTSFHVRKGEVVALAGLVGSGRTEIARLIYGADRKASGSIAVCGKVVDIAGPTSALENGIAYLTEDRKHLGLFLDMNVSDNVNMSVMPRDARALGFLDRGRAKQRTDESIHALDIRGADEGTRIGQLSGGNQQKALLARLLETEPSVLILDEPTRGVDVGAKSEIYRLIDELARKGMGILVISSELAEVIGISDRILVMREGRIVGELNNPVGAPVSQEAIMALTAGEEQGAAGIQAE